MNIFIDSSLDKAVKSKKVKRSTKLAKIFKLMKQKFKRVKK